MIHEVAGDILLSKADAIVHGVAANDPMDQGLALALHRDYPAMHKDYHHWCHNQQRKPGEAWIWASADGKRIINLITQEGGYGHGSRPGRANTKSVKRRAGLAEKRSSAKTSWFQWPCRNWRPV